MDIKTELHNLKKMVLTESHISDEAKKKIADRINQMEKGVVMNYIPCCTSEDEQLSVVWKALERKSDGELLPSFLSKRNNRVYINVVEDADVTEQWNEYLKNR